jgi:hypothetical protein
LVADKTITALSKRLALDVE